jgi:hypothetical protein
MKRKSISGWSFGIGGWGIEVVTVHHIPRLIAVYRDSWRILVKRVEW